MDEKTVLRTRDFWTSVFLILISCFFLFQTTGIPFLDTKVAGVDAADWYNSAALVPFGIFGAMLLLAIALLVIAIRDGGAQNIFDSTALGISKEECWRIGCIVLMLFFYIFGLVPRVDFILSSALLITCLIWGFHSGDRVAMLVSTGTIAVAACYALGMHFPRQEWAQPHDDDWVTLVALILLTAFMFIRERQRSVKLMRVTRLTPMIALLVPLVLVSAMAFGFRQNVPNRTGLVFSQIEYQYYVNIRPLFQESR